MYDEILKIVRKLGAFIKGKYSANDYQEVFKMASHFVDVLYACQSHPQIRRHALNGRTDDTGAIRRDLKYFVYRNETLTPEINNSKTDRGFAHPVLSRLLCPASEISSYDADPAA